MPEITHRKKRLSSFKLIVLGFAGVILLGALILMLPFSSTAGVVTPFHEALFTSTSAVCVTGLVVQDTGSYWSAFGQTVILLMIQIGGLGVVTVAAFFAMLSGRKISLMQRSTMQDAISAPKVGGIVRLTRFIVRGTFLIELIGMIVMLPTFCGNFGIKGIWMAAFHSISAFCNAGFDILGTAENKYPSLTGYIGEPTINIAIMLLIIVGGIGFLTWDDIYTNKWHFKKYRMQSKVILVTTAILIIAPAVFFFFCDFTGLPLAERILASLFQSVTPRTAGFNTADLPAMTIESKSSPGWIFVRIGRQGERLEIEIEDTGSGMAEAKLTELQNNMCNADIEMLKGGGRVGIINACVRLKMVTENRVEFRVEGEEGVGTTVTIRIPCLQEGKTDAESIAGR